jgi:hypothetical protein
VEVGLERYRNLEGDSGVLAYETGKGSITVLFKNGWCYLYTNRSAGAENIAQMQRLAKAGRGLSTFISRVTHNDFARKWPQEVR